MLESIVAGLGVAGRGLGSGSLVVDVPDAAPVPRSGFALVLNAAPVLRLGLAPVGAGESGSAGFGSGVLGSGQLVAGAGLGLALSGLVHLRAAPLVGLALCAARSAGSRCGGST